MYLPSFKIELNRQLDESEFIEFFLMDNPGIKKDMPQIKEIKDIKAAIDYFYSHQDEHIRRGLKILENNVDKLSQIAEIISKKINYRWDGIDKITISPCSFPVCPRFIETSSFMVTYFFTKTQYLVFAHTK